MKIDNFKAQKETISEPNKKKNIQTGKMLWENKQNR